MPGGRIEIIPCHFVLLRLARALLSGGMYVDNIRKLKEAGELTCLSPPGRALLLGLVRSLKFSHCLAGSTVSNLYVLGL